MKRGSISLTKISWLQTKPLWGFSSQLSLWLTAGSNNSYSRLSRGWDCEEDELRVWDFWQSRTWKRWGREEWWGHCESDGMNKGMDDWEKQRCKGLARRGSEEIELERISKTWFERKEKWEPGTMEKDCKKRGRQRERGCSVGEWAANSENGCESQPKHFCINIINRWC